MNETFDNTDAAELQKFAELSADWWDPHGKLRTLHVINPLRLRYIMATRTLPGARVLDVGCGGGLLSEVMAAEGAIVTGVDANPSAIGVATDHARASRLAVDYSCTTAEALAESITGEFDLVTCMELLEHVPDPASLLDACSSMLKPGGDLVVATLNRNARSYAMAVFAAEYLLGLLPRGTHDYARFLRPAELARILRPNGLEVLDVSGMHYLPLVERCYINDDPAVNYLLHARKQAP